MTTENLKRANEIAKITHDLSGLKKRLQEAINQFQEQGEYRVNISFKWVDGIGKNVDFTNETSCLSEKTRDQIGALALAFYTTSQNLIKNEIESLEKEFEEL